MQDDNRYQTRKIVLGFLAVIVFTQLFEISITPKYNFLRNLSGNKSKVQNPTQQTTFNVSKVDTDRLASQVIPQDGVTLPITWGDLGQQMIRDGVIDEQKFRALFAEGLDSHEEKIFSGNMEDEPIVMTQENSRFILDMLWAFGLANQNDILENGEMTSPAYGSDASKFASTGGWSLGTGEAMDHYSNHSYIVLNEEQQALVDKVSRNIYRPCCGNSTHFPDCNHGMAMLGLLELMAANGASESEMYATALQVNSLWFPQTYIDLATYFKEQGTNWDQVDAKLALSKDYSSATGYQQVRKQIKSIPSSNQRGGSCGA